MKTSKLIIAVSLAAGITSAPAATVTFTQSAAFFTALAGPGFAPSQTETYESYGTDTEILNNGGLGSYTYSNFPTYGPADPQGFLTGRIDFRDQPGTNAGFFSVAGGTKSFASFYTETSPTLLPKSPDYFFQGDSFIITLPAGTQAIGLFFNTSLANTPLPTDLFINTAVGNATNGGSNFDTTQGNNDALGSTNNLFFVGLISDTPFTSAEIGESLFGGTGWNVDNLTTATPEPTSLGLLGLGLAGIVGYSRKRTNR